MHRTRIFQNIFQDIVNFVPFLLIKKGITCIKLLEIQAMYVITSSNDSLNLHLCYIDCHDLYESLLSYYFFDDT